MVNYENFSNGENPSASDWDMSDVEDFSYSEEEKRSYDIQERALKENLETLASERAGYIFDAGDEFVKNLRQNEHPFTKRIEGNIDDLVTMREDNNRNTLNAFYDYVDSIYPSPYQKPEDRKPGDAEGDYRLKSVIEGQTTGDNLDELAKSFSIDGSERDLQIAAILRNMGKETDMYPNELSNAIIEYTKDPSQNNRANLTRIQSDHDKVMSKSLFNIAEIFSGSQTNIGKNMFDPTVELMTMLAQSSNEYFDGLMAYLKFKMEKSDVKNVVKPTKTNENQILPDVFLQ